MPVSSIHTSMSGPQNQRSSGWSSGYDSLPPQQAPQPTSYTLQSSVTLQQSIPPFVAQYSIQPVPQSMMNSPPQQGPPPIMRGGPPPHTPPRGMVGPPPNIAPPPHMRGPPQPQHIRIHPPSQLGAPMHGVPPHHRGPPHGGPPPGGPPHMHHGRGQQQQFHQQQGGVQFNQQHQSGIGRGVSSWQQY